MNWCCPNLHSVLFIVSAFILALKYANCSESECYFNRPNVTKQPSINQYGCYLTRKNECVMLRKDAKIFPIQIFGNPAVGELKLFYPPNIILNEPYKRIRVYKYNVSCPEGFLAYFRLLSLDLDPNSCRDYLEVHSSSGQLEKYCENLITAFTESNTEFVEANISHLLFRSDKHAPNNGLGFIAYMVCFRPEDDHLTGCTNGNDTDPGSTIEERDTADVTVEPSNYVPQDKDRETLDALIRAAFDVSITNTNKRFCNEDLQRALCHMKASNPVLRATARAIVFYTRKLQRGHTNSIIPSLRLVLPIDDDDCVDISNIPFCSNLNYPKAHFPNFRGHDSPAEANKELYDFDNLVNTGCSNAIVHLLCAVYAPFCYVDEKHGTSKLHPCIELCQHVRDECECVLNSKGLDWPPHLDCNNSDIYKNSSELTYCPDDPSTLVIPSTQTTTTIPDDIEPTYKEPTHYVEPAETINRVTRTNPSLIPPLSSIENECVIISQIPFCSNLNYSKAHFPNFRGHDSPADANNELSDFTPLVNTGCSNAIVHLLCAVYAPFCYVDEKQETHKLHPCIELCQYVRNGCESVLNNYRLDWPPHLDCDNSDIYKSSSELTYCPDDPCTLVIPSTHVTTTMTPTIEPVQCECKSTDLIPLCSSVGYSQTYQNFRGLSIIETNIELSSYQSLINTSCSDYLVNLLCSVYAPPCNGTDPVIKLRPCRALCRKVKEDCGSNLDIYDNWPQLFDCENDTALYQNDDELSYCPSALLHECGDNEDKDKTTTQM